MVISSNCFSLKRNIVENMSKSIFVGKVQSRLTTNSCNNEADSKDFTHTSLFFDIA